MSKRSVIIAKWLVITLFVSAFNLNSAYITASGATNNQFDVWWDFEEEIWTETKAGTAISGGSDGAMTLTQETDDTGNHYMKAAGKQASAWRASMYALSDEVMRGAEIVFDFKHAHSLPNSC